MAKTSRRVATTTRTARRQATHDDALKGLSDAPGTVSDVAAAGDKAQRDANEQERQKALHTTQEATQRQPNPPEQPKMIPAKQVEHQVVGGAPAVDPADIVNHPRNRSKPIRVQATAVGYYDDVLRRVDDVFDIYREQDFSKKWMKRVSGSTPAVVTGSNVALRKGAAANEPNEDPLGAGD